MIKLDLNEQTVDTSYVFEGRIIKVKKDKVLLPSGHTSTREVVEHNGGVCVLPIDNDGNVYFVKQFRYPYKQVVTEIPAGKREGDENPLDCGIRELKEEIGASADEVISLGFMYPSPGYCGEIIWMYLAKGLKFGAQKLDEDEFLNVEKIPLERAIEMVMNNEIHDAKTQIALMKAYLMLGGTVDE